jgi:hypothetical protein
MSYRYLIELALAFLCSAIGACFVAIALQIAHGGLTVTVNHSYIYQWEKSSAAAICDSSSAAQLPSYSYSVSQFGGQPHSAEPELPTEYAPTEADLDQIFRLLSPSLELGRKQTVEEKDHSYSADESKPGGEGYKMPYPPPPRGCR